jgi:exonuclease SbcC
VLESLSIKDFQVHRRLKLALDPHLTFLVGDSDAGKSSVLRALRWLCLNQPAGEEFIGLFGKCPFASVLGVIDGKRVYRKKGSGENIYKLDGHTLEAFGKGGVPNEVQQLLNVGDVNFQQQIDPPYWFTLTPGQLSKELNSIINLGEIDDTLANASQKVRKAKATIQLSTERLHSARQRRASLAWAVDRERRVSAAEAIQTDLNTATDTRFRGRQLLQGIEEAATRQDQLQTALARGLIAIQAGDELLKTATTAAELRTIVYNVDQLSKQAAIAVPQLEEAERLTTKLQRLGNEQATLSSLLLSISQVEHQLCLAEGLLKDAIKDLQKASDGKCPTCRQSWPSFAETYTYPTTRRPVAARTARPGTKR